MWDLIVSVPDHCLSFYFVTYVTKNGHMSQKWSYKVSCFTIYVLLDANMLQMLKT